MPEISNGVEVIENFKLLELLYKVAYEVFLPSPDANAGFVRSALKIFNGISGVHNA